MILLHFTLVSIVDSLDWKEYGVDSEINQVLNHKHLSNDAKYTPDALGTIIKGLKDKGYEIVPISELIIKDNYTINAEGRQIPNEVTNKNSLTD